MTRVRSAIPALAGLVFALGLGLSGMTQPAKVVAFLDLSDALARWDPSLAFVMAGALLVHLPFVAWARRRRPGLVALPGPIDARLIAGSAVFGVGWGLSGLCPGPAFVALAGGNLRVVVFVICLFAGIALANLGARLAPILLSSSACSQDPSPGE